MDELDPNSVAQLLAATSDIVVVMNPDGVICERVLANQDLPAETFIGWPGKAWVDTVTIESRPKIEQLLRDAELPSASLRTRQVNHVVQGQADLPVRYSVMQVGSAGHIIAAGRDLRPVAALQQRLIAAEQSMEMEYAQLRAAETRYRLLFQVTSEAIVIVDSRSGRISEANSAASELFGRPTRRLMGTLFQDLFESVDAKNIADHLSALRIAGRADDVVVTLGGALHQTVVSSALFRQDRATHYLFRLAQMTTSSEGPGLERGQSKVVEIMAGLPDGFVVTDYDRRILTVNAAFLDLAQLGSEQQARGAPIERWLGRPGVDTSVLFGQIREHGSIRQFKTLVRGELGMQEEVEVSAVAVPDGRQPCFGLTLRRVPQRDTSGSMIERALPRSVDQMTRLVGKMPLKEIVREATDIIERLCIEAALEMTSNNRASSADLLGLSRQSLYVRLHRYGFSEPSQPN